MAASTVVNIQVVTSDNPDAIEDKYIKKYQDRKGGMVALANLLNACASGNQQCNVVVSVDEADGTAAAETIACVQTNADADDTVTICGVVFTVKASPSSDAATGEFAAVTDDATMATALGAAINAHPALKGLMTAAVASDTVTCTMSAGGAYGNHAVVATSDATAFTLGSGLFASGAGGTVQCAMRAFQGGLV